MANRLAGEASPYLLQHAGNPVDWYPWGEEALRRARDEQRPILMSIGYAACHWCHVMERESFEDPDIARAMNESFVCIKVDREERPDLDAIYMEAVQAMTGRGGWPMTVFLTPDGAPFFGGTYWPPEDRGGMPGFPRILAAVAEAWRVRRPDAERQGRALLEHIDIARHLAPSDEVIAADLLWKALDHLLGTFDEVYGGFGGAPKFPQPMIVDFLLRMAARGSDDALRMAVRTLDAMAAGGMYDQIGGGFARYSVDRAWIVPHFEKMLYDNALLLRTYARSFVATGVSRHKIVAEETAAWLLRDMRDPAGGFWSSLDADSEGEEGKYYVWTLDEVRNAAGDDAPAAITAWGMTDAGNFEGRNIPVLADAAVDLGSVARARAALLEARQQRVPPATDDKVLTAWSALTAAALAEAGTLLDHPEWVEAAGSCVEFLLDEMRIEGRLMRSYRRTSEGPVVRHLAYADDYAFLLEATIVLYESTGDGRWLDEARWCADEAIRLFADDSRGGFFTTGTDAETLVVRPKDVVDNAVPSATSTLALELQRLAALTGADAYAKRALAAMRLGHEAVGRSPSAFAHLLAAIDFYTGDSVEVVITGPPGDAATQELLAVIRNRFLPNKVVVPPAVAPADTPLLEGRPAGVVAAYICRRGVCDAPVNDPRRLEESLAVA